MGSQNSPGAKKRDGNCTLQSAEYVMRFGSGTMFSQEHRETEERRVERPRVQKVKAEPVVDYVPWWKTFGFDREAKQLSSGNQRPRVTVHKLPAVQRSAAEELGLDTSRKPSREEVKAAFKETALRTHPDRGGSNEEFKRAIQARDRLLKIAA